MKKKRNLVELVRGAAFGGSFMFRYQIRMITETEKIKNRLRLAGVNDKRISAIVAEASKKAVQSFRPFLHWLDVLASKEVAGKCEANNNSE